MTAPTDERAALERIIGMCGNADRCTCGRPTGIPAIVACARAALSAQPVGAVQPTTDEPEVECPRCSEVFYLSESAGEAVQRPAGDIWRHEATLPMLEAYSRVIAVASELDGSMVWRAMLDAAPKPAETQRSLSGARSDKTEAGPSSTPEPLTDERAADVAELQAQIERLTIRGAAYENAYRIAYQATYQSHTGHWDKTGRSGAGCPECIRAREARENCDAELRDGLAALIARV